MSIQLFPDDDPDWRRYGPPTQDDDDRYDDEGDDGLWPGPPGRAVQDAPLTPAARHLLGEAPGPCRGLIRDDGPITPDGHR